MSQRRLQEYFDGHPVEVIGRGSQSVIYGADRVVVKDIRPDLLARWAMRRIGKGVDYVGSLVSVYRDAREALAGLAVPFEMPGRSEKVIWGRTSEIG